MCGALNLAALAAYAGGFGPDDVHDALNGAISEIRQKAPGDSRLLMAPRLIPEAIASRGVGDADHALWRRPYRF